MRSRAKKGPARGVMLGVLAMGLLLLPGGGAVTASAPEGGDFRLPQRTIGGGSGLASGAPFEVFAVSGAEGGTVASGGDFEVRTGSVHRGAVGGPSVWVIH